MFFRSLDRRRTLQQKAHVHTRTVWKGERWQDEVADSIFTQVVWKAGHVNINNNNRDREASGIVTLSGARARVPESVSG